MIGTVLVATDGSAHARAAVDLGAAVAGKYDARLVLLHVVFGSDLPGDLFERAKQGFEAAGKSGAWTTDHSEWATEHQIEEFAGRMLLDEAKARAEEQGAGRVETINDFGASSGRILQHARRLPADLIVMGTRGHGEWANFVLGSASHAVVHYAPCTAITVHQSEDRPGFEGVSHILVPTDGSDHAEKAVTFAGDIAAKFGAKMTLAHVLLRHANLDKLREGIDPDKLSESTRAALHVGERRTALTSMLSSSLSDDALREVGEQILERAREKAEAEGAQDVQTEIVDGNAAKAILELAKDRNVDLIAMGTRGLSQIERLVIGSVSYKVSHAAPCHCMVVR
jgi:nucleotide-binding universal stress UspA family protein